MDIENIDELEVEIKDEPQEIEIEVIPTGTEGLSAYEVAVKEGFEGTESEWLESLKGETGDNGITPDISIGTTTTLEAGSNATVTQTGTIENPIFSFGIPKGLRGVKGDTGTTPDLQIGTVQSGNESSASITGTAEEPILNLVLEKGDKGATGSAGQDGISPTVTTSKSGKVTTIEIIDKNGTHTATINDGNDGINGNNGSDGFSPSASVSKSGSVATISITDKNGTTTTTISDGTNGQNGQDGEDGVGVPSGGTEGQVLAKASGTDYDTEWINIASGGGIEGVFNIQISNLFNLDGNSSKSIETIDRPLFLPVVEYIAENPLSTPIILLTSKKNYSSYDSVSLYIFSLYNKSEVGNSKTYFFSATCPSNLDSSNNLVHLSLTLYYNASMEQITGVDINKTTYPFLNLSGNQTITGTKTFNTLPQSTVVPSSDNDLVNKKYVDDIVGDIETTLGGI